jgi:hypothetical protein
MRVSTMIILAAAGLALAACGTATPAGGQVGPAITTVGPPPAPHTVSASDADNGHTITLAVGDQLQVVLHSTYWGFTPPGAQLRMTGQHTTAIPVGTGPGHCVIGEGCGTVTADYTATSAGTTDVTASRKSCGEAMACTGADGGYRLTVIVR